MYVVGSDHPNRVRARAGLARLFSERERLVTDAEVFQEILHRYSAIRRRSAIGPAFHLLSSIADRVFPVEMADVSLARLLLAADESIKARDALHLAVMKRHGVERVFTFDRHFDQSGIERFEPA